LPNSAISTKSGSFGSTYFWSAGNAGASVSEYDTVYGVPVGERILIDMKQRRADFRTEITQPFGVFKAGKARFGIADYTHSEIDEATGLPNTTFNNKAYEARAELAQRDEGKLTGSIGAQVSRSNFSAVGAEVVTPATLTHNYGLFAVESYKVSPKLTLQFGGRYEQQKIRLGDVDPALPAYPGYSARSGQKRTDDSLSFSTAAVYFPAKDYSVGVSLAYSQRVPVAQELFSNGPHGGTGAYEIGTAGLDNESSVGFDVTVRKRAGFATGSVGAFVHRFNDFIFEQRDSNSYFDEDTGSLLAYPEPVGAAILPVYQFVARDAVFYGGEAEVALHLVDTDKQRLHLELTSDFVHARKTTSDEALPRIPPLRMGAGLRYEQDAWSVRGTIRHAFRQNRVSPGETETSAYTLVGAEISYRWKHPRVEWEIFARGTNLLDENARVSTSFLKDIAPLPGRGLTAGVRMAF
jgi:iron complex outermembrane recepter protein